LPVPALYGGLPGCILREEIMIGYFRRVWRELRLGIRPSAIYRVGSMEPIPDSIGAPYWINKRIADEMNKECVGRGFYATTVRMRR